MAPFRSWGAAEPDEITARILVILQGQIRLVGRHNGRLTTVQVRPCSGGAASLQRAPCENVIAAEEEIAVLFRLNRELYSQEARSVIADQCSSPELLNCWKFLSKSLLRLIAPLLKT